MSTLIMYCFKAAELELRCHQMTSLQVVLKMIDGAVFFKDNYDIGKLMMMKYLANNEKHIVAKKKELPRSL